MQTQLLPLFVTLQLAACVPAATQVSPPNATRGGENQSPAPGTELESTDGPVPPPPDAKASLTLIPPFTEQIKSGPQLCFSERLDLTQTIIRIDLNAAIPPEEFLLLQTWVKSSTEATLGESVEWGGLFCKGAFLCLRTGSANTPKTLKALSQNLSHPSPASLLSARRAAIAKAKELDASSVSWRLDTASAALRRRPAPLVRAISRWQERASSEESAADIQLERSLRAETGASRMSKINTLGLRAYLQEQHSNLRVTLSGPQPPKNAVFTFSNSWKEKEGIEKTAPSPDSSSEPSMLGLIRLSQDASEWTHALLTWAPSGNGVAIRTGILLLAERLRTRAPTEVLITSASTSEFGAALGFRIEGPYEQVLETITAAEEQHQRITSLSGAPTTSELKRAFATLRLEHSSGPDARCWSQAQAPTDGKTVAQALRASRSPLSLLWGRNSSPVDNLSEK